ncbi:hypothetical protein KHM83_16290 [Fusibacter paucivorans]|uniref:Alcohol acetyltransferase n=1 Tax=Fusibacter paucivorans TaxID=76009 RepID=A0ABS5PSV3_9FIRM|nr:hypothetical protein [Fusibacter paucivorans]MBS7528249.1 hypothetical protein [Fusibacter paucivorans]
MRYKRKKSDSWFKLDNAGKLYPSIASSRVSTTFRITAVLKETVHAGHLQLALDAACKCYPVFNVRLRRGLFWYYFENVNEAPKVLNERYFPCNSIRLRHSHAMPFSLLYYKKRIHLEMSHAISDGAGAMVFFKCILKNYYRLSHHMTPIRKIQLVEGQDEDAFEKYYQPKLPNPRKVSRAFHFPFKLIEKGEYRITTGLFSYDGLKGCAAKYDTSPTKFLLMLLFETIQDYIESSNLSMREITPIIINMPVDLRGYYDSVTVRNFFISLTPQIDVRLGHYTREEILREIDHYLALNLNTKHLSQYIRRNFRNELFWHVRVIPLFIKNAIIPIVYNYYGESSYTTSLSNIGSVKMEAPYDTMIEHLELLPPPSEGNIIKATMISYKDITALSFGSLTEDRTIERLFFRKLREEGLHIKMETNY